MEQVRKPDFVATFDDSDSDSEVELSSEPFHNTSWKPQEKPIEKPIEKAIERPVEKAIERPVVKEESFVSLESNKPLAETIEIPHPSSIFPHIIATSHLPSKFHHFQFRHASDLKRMTQMIQQADSNIEVIPNESNKDNVDITLQSHGETVGKIQFLHFDRRDKDDKSKYYVKIYFYQFQSATLFQKMIEVVKGFFISLASSKHSVHRPSVKRQHPSVKRQHPSVKRQHPSVKRQHPSVKRPIMKRHMTHKKMYRRKRYTRRPHRKL